MSENSADFILDAQNGNTDAFAKLYSRTLKQAWYLALKLTHSEDEARKIIKEAYADAFCSVNRLKKPDSYESWIKQKVASAYKDTQNFVYSDASGDASSLGAEFLPADVLEDSEFSAKIENEVAALPVEQRTVCVLYYCVGMPVDFIAKFLGVSPSSVNSLLSKASETLGNCVDSSVTDVEENALPVLTRIFQKSASRANVPSDLVRNAFVYAIDKYDAAVNETAETVESDDASEEADVAADEDNADVVSDDAVAEEEVAAAAEETVEADTAQSTYDIPVVDDSEEDVPSVSIDPSSIIVDEAFSEEEPVVTSEGDRILGDIQQTIVDLNNDPNLSEDPKAIYFKKREDGESSGEDVGFEIPDSIQTGGGDNDKPKKAKKEKKKKEKSSGSKQGVIALLVIILVLAAVCVTVVLVKKKHSVEPTPEVTSTVQEEKQSTFVMSDAFDGMTDIEYFNEYSIKFKDAETGLYGLMDNNGIVRIDPVYYDFNWCSYGELYSSNDSYHYTAKVSENAQDFFEVSFPDFKVGDTIHESHGMNYNETFTSDKYSARDRSFNGYYAVKDAATEKWGYMSESDDSLVISCKYEAVNVGGSFAEINYGFDICRAVSDNMVAVKSGTKMGIISIGGTEIAPFEYDVIMQGENGVYVACKNGNWGYILVGDAKVPEGLTTFETDENGNPIPGQDNLPEGCTYLNTTFVVDNSEVNIRADHDKDSELLATYENGTEIKSVCSFETNDGKTWIGFVMEDGKLGWISRAFVKVVD